MLTRHHRIVVSPASTMKENPLQYRVRGTPVPTTRTRGTNYPESTDIHRWPFEGTKRDIASVLVHYHFPEARPAPVESRHLTFEIDASSAALSKSIQRKAIEFGVNGAGTSNGPVYSLHVEGTVAAINRLTDWLTRATKLRKLKVSLSDHRPDLRSNEIRIQSRDA